MVIVVSNFSSFSLPLSLTTMQPQMHYFRLMAQKSYDRLTKRIYCASFQQENGARLNITLHIVEYETEKKMHPTSNMHIFVLKNAVEKTHTFS